MIGGWKVEKKNSLYKKIKAGTKKAKQKIYNYKKKMAKTRRKKRSNKK